MAPTALYTLPKWHLRPGVTPSGRFYVRRSVHRRGTSHLRTTFMVGFLINRLLHAVAVLFGVVSVTFVLLHLAGDPLAGLIPPGASPEVERQIRSSYGLDRPWPEQYLDFMGRAMRGDFGDSWRQGRTAIGAVLERLPATLALTAVASALAVTIGCLLGVTAAARPGSFWDTVARLTALLGQAIPAF